MNMRAGWRVATDTMEREGKIKGPRKDRVNLQDRINNIQGVYSGRVQQEGTMQWIKE